jgi:5-methyltetrahydrofolate--homocysteine methyltransferase
MAPPAAALDVGLISGDAPELWNVDHPDRLPCIELVEAGADILLTNSFGGTAYRLKLHRAESSCR